MIDCGWCPGANTYSRLERVAERETRVGRVVALFYMSRAYRPVWSFFRWWHFRFHTKPEGWYCCPAGQDLFYPYHLKCAPPSGGEVRKLTDRPSPLPMFCTRCREEILP